MRDRYRPLSSMYEKMQCGLFPKEIFIRLFVLYDTGHKIPITDLEERITRLKNALKRIHEEEDPEKVKEEVKDVLKSLKPWEIPLIEQTLIKEGVDVSRIVRMCDIHVELFREALIPQELRRLPEGHPLHTPIKENAEVLKYAEKIGLYANILESTTSPRETLEETYGNLTKLSELRSHFAREQMLVFPYLERRGITAVPRVLWSKQDQVMSKIRYVRKSISDLLQEKFLEKEELKELKRRLLDLSKALMDMVFRENNILYPTLNVLLSEGEWAAIKEEEELIGYFRVRPGEAWKPEADPIYPYQIKQGVELAQLDKLPEKVRNLLTEPEREDSYKLVRPRDVRLSEGYLSPVEIDGILRALPLDVSFY